jgi:WD40 repeat protein
VNPLAPSDPAQLGPYTLIGRLGSGGMGAVYLGRSSGGRQVAIKVIHDHLAQDPGFRLRFAREVNAARQVGGLYTAQVVGADTEADLPWMATRFVPGPSLSEYVSRRGPLTPQEVKVLAAGVSEALASIHAQGLVHRDLKPGNVLLSPEGPQVIDFGIAVDRQATSFTSTGVLLGTFEFISPEQVANHPVTPAADVFALGGLLCYAATGAPPFGTGHPAVLIARVIDAEPDLSRVTDPELRDLIAGCLNKRPERRPTPQQIIERTASAREATRVPFSSNGTTDPTGTPDAGTGNHSGNRLGNHPGDRRVTRRTVLAGAAAATALAAAGGTWLATRRPGGTPATAVPTSTDFAGHPGAVNSVALSPDGSQAVVGGNNAVTTLFDVRDGRRLHSLVTHTAVINTVAFSPDGRTVASGTGDKNIVLWDVAGGTAVRTLTWSWQRNGAIDSVAFSPDGKRLLSGTGDGTVQLWNLSTGALERTLTGGKGPTFAVAFAPDGRTVAGTNLQGTGQIWDATSGKLVRSLPAQKGSAAVAYSPDGTLLAVSGEDHTIRLSRVADGKPAATITAPATAAGLAWTPDGKSLLSGHTDKTVRFWDPATGKAVGNPLVLDDWASTLAISRDGGTLVTGSLGGQTTLWNLPARTRRRSLAASLTKAIALAVWPDGSTVGTGAENGTVRLWTGTGAPVRGLTLPKPTTASVKGHDDGVPVYALAVSRTGTSVAAGTQDGRIAIWDPRSGTLQRTLKPGNGDVLALRYLDDGTLLSGGNGIGITRWNADGTARLKIPLADDAVYDLAVTPDQTQVVGCIGVGSLIVHDLISGAQVRTLRGHASRASAVDVSPDGKTIVSSSDDKTVRLWNLTSGQQLRVLTGHLAEVSIVRFSPDGATVASGGSDRQVRLWDVATGATIRTLDHPDWVENLAYLPGGRSLVVTCGDGTIRRWSLPAR